jgi:hypothetical protein
MGKSQRMKLKALIYGLIFIGGFVVNLDFVQKAVPMISIIDLWMECSDPKGE